MPHHQKSRRRLTNLFPLFSLFVVLVLIFALSVNAFSAASDVKTGLYTRTINTNTVAKLQVLNSASLLYSAKLTSTPAVHTYGTRTAYTCTQTVSATRAHVAGPIEGASYGSVFLSMANSVGLYNSITTSMVAGQTYYVPASKSTGNYYFRAEFYGARIYENVDQTIDGVTTSLFYRAVPYVPAKNAVEIVAYIP